MGIVTRTITYPDGRVEETIVDMAKKTSKKKVSKSDESKSKPVEKRKSVRQAYKTSSES